MMPLASWLMCPWRHTKSEGYASVIEAAQKLDAQVWATHKIKLLYCDDADRFRDISTAEVQRVTRGASPECDPDYPQLGMHADPTCRALDKDNFFALIGTKTDRPLPLYTMNTAAKYEARPDCPTIAELFTGRELWSDHPDRDCAGLEIECGTEVYDLPAVFLGTAWTRQDYRGRGIMREVSRLHRMVAYLRYGHLPQFATVKPDSGHEKVFGGRQIGSVTETWPTHTTTSTVLFYEPADILAAAERVKRTAD